MSGEAQLIKDLEGPASRIAAKRLYEKTDRNKIS